MERQVWNPVTGWWENQPTPRAVVLLITLAHIFAGVAGLSVLTVEPTFLAVGLGGGLLTTIWGGLLVFSGVVGAASAPFGAYWAERIALAAQGLAVLIYVVAMIDLQRLVAANITYQVWLLVMLLLHVVIRFERVRHGMRDPERTTTGSLPRQRRRR